MTPATTAEGRSRNLILAAMIFAVSMTFIDQTIISIAALHIQRELGLSATGVQWAVNAHLLALAALFADIMAAAALTAVAGLRQGRQQEPGEAQVAPAPRVPQQEIRSGP